MLTDLLNQGISRAGLAPDLPFVQILGIRQDRTSYLVYAEDGRSRVANVKVTSSESGVESLVNEYATLTRLAGTPGLLGRQPVPRAWLEVDGTAVSVVSSMAGRPLDVVLSRRLPMTARRMERYADAVVSWLDGLQSWTRHGSTRLDPYATADQLNDAGTGRDHVQRTYRLLAAHADVRLPKVTGHGDLWPGNVLVDAAGRVSVVDWETAAESADPYDDLLFFLLTFVRATLPDGASLPDAVTAGLLGGTAWRSVLVRRHLLRALDRDGVPQRLADPLALRFLARRAAHDTDRSKRGLPSSSEWPAALERFVEGRR